jgi:circadian clock protein KaiB
VVDIYREPQEARKYQIVALPTLLKLSPAPKRLFIGDMSDIRPLSAELGLIE